MNNAKSEQQVMQPSTEELKNHGDKLARQVREVASGAQQQFRTAADNATPGMPVDKNGDDPSI